jgi:antitoxin component of MazEF toxin-antitoxin module
MAEIGFKTAISKVYRQGNSLAVILPKAVVEKLQLEAGKYIKWTIFDDGEIKIEKV